MAANADSIMALITEGDKDTAEEFTAKAAGVICTILAQRENMTQEQGFDLLELLLNRAPTELAMVGIVHLGGHLAAAQGGTL